MSERPRAALQDAADEAIRRHVAETDDPFRIAHTRQVTSFGGSGTTSLISHLLDAGVDLQPGPAQWPFKHQRVPPVGDDVPQDFRVVYVVGDPRDAVLSIFRRNIQIGHYEALHGHAPSGEVAENLESLDTFLAAGIDHFGFGEHVRGWMSHPPGYPVMFIRYHHLVERWNDVCDFIGLSPDHPAPRLRSRRSDWTSRVQVVRAQLDAMYGQLAATIDAFAPIQIL